jgi:rhamnogalacturonan endolyase
MFLAYDFNGTGKAQVAMKTADGTVDGVGNVIGDPTADWMMANGQDERQVTFVNLDGPLYLTVFDGETGAALDTVPYDPQTTVEQDELLNTPENRTETGRIDDDHSYWGDYAGNRSERYNACVAYLDGEKPSMVFQRGMFAARSQAMEVVGSGRITLAAYNFTKQNKIEKVWRFDTFDASQDGTEGTQNNKQVKPGMENIFHLCTHDIVAGDVDGSGRDSIILGHVAIKYDGTLLWMNEGRGHGDFMHLGKFMPDREGLQLFVASFDTASLVDAGTGEVIDGLERTYGEELHWGQIGTFCKDAVMITHREMYNTRNRNVRGKIGYYRIHWDGGLYDQLMSGDDDGNFDIENLTTRKHYDIDGCASVYGPYYAPNAIADVFGDWREEFITRSGDGKNLRIYTTTIPTDYRCVTFMYDPLYRIGVVNQVTAIAMPPRIGFTLGEKV